MACELSQDGFLLDSHDTLDSDKIDALCGHSERSASMSAGCSH